MSKHLPKAISNTNVLIAILLVTAVGAALIAIIRIDHTSEKKSGLSPEFTYDISEKQTIDPKLIIAREIPRKIQTGFTLARGIAIDNLSRIYVAGDKSIRIYDKNGTLISKIELSQSPQCLAIESNDIIYVGMQKHVEVYDRQGKKKSSWDSPGPQSVFTSIAVTESDVFVADMGNRIVLRYDKSGSIKGNIGRKNPQRNIPGFVIPSPNFDLAMGFDGLLRVVNPGNHRIEAYTVNGDMEFAWGKASYEVDGFCGCCNPANFALLPDGSFVTCEKGLTRVKVYNSDGLFLGVVAGPEQFIEHDRVYGDKSSDSTYGSLDVAVDPQGRIHILDPTNGEVRIFELINRNN